MKQNYFVISILLLSLLFIGKPTQAQSPNELIGQLIGGDDMFELQKQHDLLKDSIIPMLDCMSEAMLAVSFNQPDKGIKALEDLLSNEDYQAQLGIGTIANFIYLNADVFENKYNFKAAVKLLQSFLEQTKDVPLGQIKSILQNKLEFNTSLAKAKAFKVVRPNKDCEIDFHLEKAGRGESLMVNAEINGKDLLMIFDTGCPKYSLLSESTAKNLGIVKIADSISMVGVGKGTAWVGTTDSLCLGEIICYNPIFYVVPKIVTDTTLNDFAVLGADIFNALDEVNFYPKNKKIIFPAQLSVLPESGNNLVMKNRQPYLKLNLNGKSCLMHFDSGNVQTYLTHHYYERNKASIEKLGVMDSLRIGGFGGISIQKSYRLPLTKFELEGREFNFDQVQVSTESALHTWREDGIFGTDFLQKFNKIVLSYKHMFISVE
ncbi:retropepsin-like aspartic protease [Ancylomarina sp.]|uniref:retropepsin-like aspartic protease n=1 Tax=Ancylomarina sp. TaxID=1970196 RepID=UPI0035613898